MINWDLDYQVVDMHTHMGCEPPLYTPLTDADSMVKTMIDSNVEFVVCNHLEDLFGTGGHRKIIDAMNRYPDRFKGYYCANPILGIDPDEIHKIFQENPGFVGFKVGPDYHRTPLTHPDYAPIMELAHDCRMLMLSHTFTAATSGVSCNDAKEVEGVVARYPNITFLMGHSIQGQVDWAIEIARKYPNAYDYLCKVFDTGVYAMFDNFGKEYYFAKQDAVFAGGPFAMDLDRVRMIIRMVEENHTDRLMLATDVCLKSLLHTYGGWSYDHIFTNIVPMMANEGISQADIDRIIRQNPERFICSR